MKLSFLTNVLPDGNQVFYELFNQGAALSTSMAKLLYDVVSDEWIPEQKTEFNQISRLKAQANEIKREVYAASGKAFVSPFERNDMYELASAINTVSDFIDISARRLNLYSIEVITPPLKELCSIILGATTALEKGVQALNNISDSATITNACNQVKQLEHQADQIYSKAFASLNSNETDTFQLIKYSEVLGALERTTDKCEQAVFVIESILIKNS